MQEQLILDYTKPEDWHRVSTYDTEIYTNIFKTGVSGFNLCHIRHGACESPEHSILQHTVVVHEYPEVGSERRLDTQLQVEYVDVGDIAIVPADVLHWQGITQEVVGAIALTIDPQIFAQAASEIANIAKVELIPTFAKPDLLIHGIALNLKAELTLKKSNQLYVESLFNTFLLHLLRHYCTSTINLDDSQGGLSRQQLHRALEMIDTSLDQSLSIKEIEDELDMSSYYFCRRFRQSMGVPPYKYLIQQRVERAKQLLRHQPHQTILDIALDCGFASHSHLNRHFRKLTGITPRAYRQG